MLCSCDELLKQVIDKLITGNLIDFSNIYSEDFSALRTLFLELSAQFLYPTDSTRSFRYNVSALDAEAVAKVNAFSYERFYLEATIS